jgi:hypothetical protein
MQSRYKWQLDSELYPRGWTWRNLVMHVAAVFLPYFVTATLFHELYAAAVRLTRSLPPLHGSRYADGRTNAQPVVESVFAARRTAAQSALEPLRSVGCSAL